MFLAYNTGNIMEANNPYNQSYWFVVREDPSNVIFNSNNFTIPAPQSQEHRYVVDASDNQQYVPDEGSVVVQDNDTKSYVNEVTQTPHEADFWDRNKVKFLLSLCQDNRFKCDKNDVQIDWNEIAILVGTTPEECDKKYRNLRRTFIRLLKKKRAGKDIKWVHYSMCEDVFKDCQTMSLTSLDTWEDVKVRKLLSLYIENLSKFHSPDCLQKDIWKDIAAQLNTTYYNCYHKFKNLKRTYLNWVEKSRESGKLIKWPYHQYFERIFYNYNPDIGPWHKNKIKELINAYSEIAHKFRNPKYQKKELWRVIGRRVGETPSNCDRKFRNLKQTYIRLKVRVDAGKSVTKWRYYKDFVSIFENVSFAIVDDGQEIVYKSLEQDYVKQLLTFYIENKEKFRDPLVKKRSLWRMIGPTIGMSPEECDKKFRNLKQTYIRLAEKKRDTGKTNGWPYYSYFQQIYGEPKSFKKKCGHNCIVDDATISEITALVHTQESNDRDKFEKLVQVIEDSNSIQRQRNKILEALLHRK